MTDIVFGMRDALFLFEWQVDQDGYEIAERDGVLLVMRRGGPFRGYRLDIESQDAGLFREFAALDQSTDAALQFAGQHGFLFQEVGPGELLDDWRRAIGTMKALVQAIDDGRHEDYWAMFNSRPELGFRPIFSARIEPN